MICAILAAMLAQNETDSIARREAYLDVFNAIVEPSPEWSAWQERTGELPPDWETMPTLAGLPSPLSRWEDGAWLDIDDAADWPTHRAALLEQFGYWVTGSWPDAPENISHRLLEESVEPDGTRREYELRFGPNDQAKLWVQLLIPPCDGPFPVFLTQHNHRAWARIAMGRGYLGVVYAGSDSRDDTATFMDAYPGYDWSKLTRRAWAASRCIDFLESDVPYANTDQIAMTGHSRNGKMSLFATAMDERIGVVISSSSGTGGPLPSRIHSEQHFAEGIENITRRFEDWFHPRWRFFTGQEHHMPFDLHQLTGLTAPRAVLLAIGINDGVESTWAMEQAYHSLKPAWSLLGVEDRLRIEYRAGGHENSPFVIERYIDWCDTQFGRASYEFPERFLHPYDWNAWAASRTWPEIREYPDRPWGESDRSLDPDKLRETVEWALGQPIPDVRSDNDDYGLETTHEEVLLRRSGAPSGLDKDNLGFGSYIDANVYMPDGFMEDDQRHPTVLWLHPQSNAMGFVPSYRRGRVFHENAARAGFVTFCYDQIGHGGRVLDAESFYTRYPEASLLGVMTRDAQAALDAMTQLPYVDPKRIYVVGYGLGAYVATHLAAVDDRPAGYALVSPPPPYRLDTDVARTGGIERWAKWHMLAPRLGAFVGNESRVPYDVDELVAQMAPRPVQLLAERYDRESPVEYITALADAARKLADAESDWLTLEVTNDYAHFDDSVQQHVIDWLEATASP